MSQMIDLELARRVETLQALGGTCRQEMHLRWPDVDFDGESWAIKTLYGANMLDVWFSMAIKDFTDKDPSYILALRCLNARKAFEGKTKTWRLMHDAWRLLNNQTVSLAALRRHHMHELEGSLVKTATPLSAHPISSALSMLGSMLDELAHLEVISHLAWGPSAATKATLRNLKSHGRMATKDKKQIDVLDRQIEGLSDATKAMLLNDERLSAMDRSAIAVANILMCAPSRINEPLCMRITDRHTIEDYAKRPSTDDGGKLFQAHQLLLMKGSKGAAWSSKPVLNFMLGLSEICWNNILQLGQRSRTLLKHYERTPDTLYLPPELEHLRSEPVSKRALWQIVNLSDQVPSSREVTSILTGVWATFINRQEGKPSALIMVDNPLTHRSDGQRNNIPMVAALPWDVAEAYLLDRVHERMKAMRRVTVQNSFDGPLSEMLMLVDSDRTPYLPQAWNDNTFRSRLKSPPWRARKGYEASVFMKLGLQMTKDGELVDCYLEPHDTRRWLTTKALEAGERLSDVLINKWANRIGIAQLTAYDLRTKKQRADQIEVPLPQELESITAGLTALAGIEDEYGLRTELAVVPGDSLTVTSFNEVMQATENRPVARSGNQILILYPNRFGVCLHQHHETPCRAYGTCSEGCNEQLTVKGHLPSNEEWRKKEALNNRGIVNQLQALLTARSRGLADDPGMLDAHLLALVKGVNVQTMADELIQQFHEIKDQIRDLHFRNELEAAFVSRGVVARLNDEVVPNGSLIKYHNPSKHASPGYERAIDVRCGGRITMERQSALFHQKYPELAPKASGLLDKRDLLEGRDEDE